MNQALQLEHELAISPAQEEEARKEFVSALRRHVLTTMATGMRSYYDAKVLPEIERSTGTPPSSGPQVHKAMRQEKPFKFFTAVRTSAQEMSFASVITGVERDLDSLNARAALLRDSSDESCGSLTLDDSVAIPRNVSEIDVHLTPGCYHSEYAENDTAAGAIYDNALKVFTFGQMGVEMNDIGATMANYVRLKFPEFRPEKILDCGCTIGHNALPWAEAFPEAEVHGIDVAPGVLRYAHSRARSKGVPVHFQQMNATDMKFEDNSFDVVFSSMFLHELPLKDIHAFFSEAYRVLKPGGLLWNMELPPNSAMQPYESFYLDWDSFYNNEPYYKTFRDQNYEELVTSTGFATEDFLQATLPRYTFVGEEAFSVDLELPMTFDSRTGRMDPKGTRWYGFGGWKKPAGAAA
ncbi:MAG: ubiquinone/menaquinone biosynthesis C-methylase UbiE [Halieaceae bacterium]|jgi:ubiquinone/menaquinone biosynthesis C-methylase UbiE